MHVSVDLSMYPLNEDYKPSIINFVKRLRATEGLQVDTNGMSTQVYGEYDLVMNTLQQEIKAVFSGPDKVSIVMKAVNDDLSGPIGF
jgi:uncharacterized protein YqgV (UPF0045/DUF77 family)